MFENLSSFLQEMLKAGVAALFHRKTWIDHCFGFLLGPIRKFRFVIAAVPCDSHGKQHQSFRYQMQKLLQRPSRHQTTTTGSSRGKKNIASGTSPVQLQVVASSLDRNPVLHQSFWRGNDSALFSKPEITMQGVQNAYDSFWSVVLRLNMWKNVIDWQSVTKVKFFPLFFRIDYHFTPFEVCNLTAFG